MKKKIWYIARADLSEPGSAATIHSRADVSEFNKIGWDATLFSYRISGKSYENRPNEEIVTVSRRKISERFLFEFNICKKLFFDEVKPNFIYLRGPTNLVFIGLVGKILGIPVVLELNGVFGYRYKKKYSIIDWINKLSDKFYAKYSDLVVAVTEELFDNWTKKLKKEKYNVIVSRNGVDIKDISLSIRNKESDVLTIGYLGQAYRYRGLADAVRSIKIMKDRGVPSRLKIIGGGPETECLKALSKEYCVEDSVMFFDSVSPNALGNHVHDCNLMWASYEKTPELDLCGLSPLKIWTYLALEKPVLVRDPGVLAFYHDVPGLFWTEANNAVELSDDILSIWHKCGKQELRNIGISGYTYVKENVSWGNHIAAIATEMERLQK